MNVRKRPHVLVVGPEGLAIEEANALKQAFEEGGATASAFRTDKDFKLAELAAEMPSATHLLLALDRVDGYASSILLEADKSKSIQTAFLCLYSGEALTRYHHRIREGRVSLIVLRFYTDHARARTHWPMVSMVVADPKDLRVSAADIARMFIGPKSKERQMSATG